MNLRDQEAYVRHRCEEQRRFRAGRYRVAVGVTADELAAAFDVSRSTARRWMWKLSATCCGFRTRPRAMRYGGGEQLVCVAESSVSEGDAEQPHIKKRINRAFRLLRTRHRVYAKQRTKCCGGCSSADLGAHLEEHPEYIGACFYHEQAAEAVERAKDYEERLRGSDRDRVDLAEASRRCTLYLSYFHRDDGDERTEEVGAIVCHVMRKCGVDVEWNGDASRTIAIPLLQDEIRAQDACAAKQ